MTDLKKGIDDVLNPDNKKSRQADIQSLYIWHYLDTGKSEVANRSTNLEKRNLKKGDKVLTAVSTAWEKVKRACDLTISKDQKSVKFCDTGFTDGKEFSSKDFRQVTALACQNKAAAVSVIATLAFSVFDKAKYSENGYDRTDLRDTILSSVFRVACAHDQAIAAFAIDKLQQAIVAEPDSGYPGSHGSDSTSDICSIRRIQNKILNYWKP